MASVVLFLAAGCSDGGTFGPEEASLPASAHLITSVNSRMLNAARITVRDDSTYDAVWDSVFINTSARPAVDFMRDMVLFVVLGSRESTGYSITVDAARDRGIPEVWVTTVEPGPECAVGHAITVPVDVVRIAMNPREPIYNERTLQIDC